MKKIHLDKNNITSLFIKNLNATYGNSSILNDCSFSLEPGKLYCLCGPNGSGKSTLLSILAGLNDEHLKLTHNQNVNIKTPAFSTNQGQEVSLSSLNRKQAATLISFLQQEEYSTWNFTVKDYVLQGRFCYTENAVYSVQDYQIAENAIKETGIIDLKNRTVHSLSGGEFQKVRIARCLCQEPQFLLLDEPASSLDFVYEPKLLQQLKNLAHTQKKAILISIHDINLALRFADQLLLLKKGAPIIKGTPKEIFTKETIANVYGSECKIYIHPIFNCPQVCD